MLVLPTVSTHTIPTTHILDYAHTVNRLFLTRNFWLVLSGNANGTAVHNHLTQTEPSLPPHEAYV